MRDDENQIGLTYMKSTLVKLGQRLGAILRIGDHFGWASYSLLLLGLLGGHAAGVITYGAVGLAALWFSAIAAALSVVAAAITEPHGYVATTASD